MFVWNYTMVLFTALYECYVNHFYGLWFKVHVQVTFHLKIKREGRYIIQRKYIIQSLFKDLLIRAQMNANYFIFLKFEIK